MLLGFYLIFKFVAKEYINYVLFAYFSIFGSIAVFSTLDDIARRVLPTSLQPKDPLVVKFTRASKDLGEFRIDWLNVTLFVASCSLVAAYFWTKHWALSNLLGEAFAISAISMLSLDSFKTGMIMLSGLFFYDIFWVFGTEVMVSVAKSFDAPIKLLFPRDIFAEKYQLALLGLGDIVVPGTLIETVTNPLLLLVASYQSYSKPWNVFHV